MFIAISSATDFKITRSSKNLSKLAKNQCPFQSGMNHDTLQPVIWRKKKIPISEQIFRIRIIKKLSQA